MSQKIILCFLAVATITILLGTSHVAAQTDLPGWFHKPPNDTDEFVYVRSSGETLRDAVVWAFYNLATKDSVQVGIIDDVYIPEGVNTVLKPEIMENIYSVSIGTRNFSGIQISGFSMSYEEYGDSGSGEDYKSTFETVSKLRFEDEPGSYYEVILYMYEMQEGSEVEFSQHIKEKDRGTSISNLLEYLKEHPDIEISHETRWGETGYTYFVLMKYYK